jgi:hypothetical protein
VGDEEGVHRGIFAGAGASDAALACEDAPMEMRDEPIAAETLALAIRGRNLSHATLGAELGRRATALVFLRHYG